MVDIVVKHSQNPLFFTLFEYLHSQIFFFSHWLSVDNSRNKRVSVFFFVMLHWFWNKNWFVLDQTYFFENKELLKKYGHPFVQQCFLKCCTNLQGGQTCHPGNGAMGTWQPMILYTYFTSSSSWKFSWDSSFNLARSICSFYWCYIHDHFS